MGDAVTHKFMQTVDKPHFKTLEEIAKERGITVQQLIRGTIIPDWMRKEKRAQRQRKTD